jgi:hypothetical protein
MPTPNGHLAALHARFLSILPRIETHASIVFRHVRCPHRQADCIQETVSLAWKWFVRLASRGKDACQFPSTLATYAARAVKSGRRVCGQEKAKDVLSPLAQQRHSFVVSTLPQHSTLSTNPFSEALADNTKSPPDEQAAFRMDFPAWLVTLGDRNRRIAEDLALGHRTKELATMHRITEGRVSQLRREFYLTWLLFHGERVTYPAHPRVGIA